METGKFLERRALLAGACALPLVAVGAVVMSDEDPCEPTCKGCGGASGLAARTPGDAGTLWCAACVDLSIDTHPAAQGAVPFDCVIEDDEP